MDLSSKSQRIKNLTDWLENQGCFISPKLQYPTEISPNLHGMTANSQINPSETLTEIRPSALFSTELLLTSPISPLFSQYPDYFGSSNPEALDNQFLAHFLYEKVKKDSKWQLFFEVLPEQIENLSDWTDDELNLLQDPDLFSDILIRKSKNKSSYARLQEILNSHLGLIERKVSLAEIEWSWKVIWTRSFMRSPSHSALIPFADLINHGESSTCFYFSDQQEEGNESSPDFDELYESERIEKLSARDLYEINFSAYERADEDLFDKAKNILILADRINKSEKQTEKKPNDERNPDANFIISVGPNETYAAGQQILFEYGNYSNTSLLIHYGFALAQNRHEFFRMKIRISEVLNATQMRFLPLKYDPEGYLLFLLNRKELNKEMIRVLRCCFWNLKYSADCFFDPGDLGLELKVLSKYLKIVRKSKEKIGDIEVEPNNFRAEFAGFYRTGKRKVLERQIELALRSIQVIQEIKSGNKEGYSDEGWYIGRVLEFNKKNENL